MSSPLVNPQRNTRFQIAHLTSISAKSTVCDASTIDVVLPMFLEFPGDSVLVARNAGFDIRCLRAAAQQCDLSWPRPPVLRTVQLAVWARLFAH
ncbi:exonuclease domain-containing protein [Mycobacterium lepromatosis]|uniref:exonuclease domain-containing protein n=1 Tax=Mycobacterium lepromatosis TaxID=480418 RepID=UPI0009E1CF28